MAIWYFDAEGHPAVYLSDGWVYSKDGKGLYNAQGGHWYDRGKAVFYESGKWVYSMDGKATYYRD